MKKPGGIAEEAGDGGSGKQDVEREGSDAGDGDGLVSPQPFKSPHLTMVLLNYSYSPQVRTEQHEIVRILKQRACEKQRASKMQRASENQRASKMRRAVHL